MKKSESNLCYFFKLLRRFVKGKIRRMKKYYGYGSYDRGIWQDSVVEQKNPRNMIWKCFAGVNVFYCAELFGGFRERIHDLPIYAVNPQEHDRAVIIFDCRHIHWPLLIFDDGFNGIAG